MPLSKNQKAELKKIDSSFKKIEQISSSNNISPDDFARESEFAFEDKTEKRQREIFDRNEKRKDIFESERRNDRAF